MSWDGSRKTKGGEDVAMFDLAPLTVTSPNLLSVAEVWEFWLLTLRSKSGTRCVLSDKRRRKIEKAIESYGVEGCKKAILGCSMSDFHMGRNGSGTKYDDVELILRDPEHIERFISIYEDGKDTGL